jgi:hypothetical protein
MCLGDQETPEVPHHAGHALEPSLLRHAAPGV